jgi:glycosyltransferase involved in cell wall biosynthesis
MIFIVDIESVETRYTAQWKKYLPKQLTRHTNENVMTISGGDTPQATTPGAFLNFGGTNVYKSKQLEKIGEMFCNGDIKDGDYFLYTDAWNPTVIQLKYMSELLGVKIKIGGMWHAGSYDPADFLGRLIGDKPWVRNAERSMFECYDDNFFATDFHIKLFKDTLDVSDKTTRTGWPMEYMSAELEAFKDMPKKDIILFPHRIAPEKQPDMFYDIKESLPQYEFVVAQEKTRSKDDYHNLLAESKMLFSANLQETLGISGYEGLLLDVIPMVPDRLSYSEMYEDDFKYPSDWTMNMQNYQAHKEKILNRIVDYMDNYDRYKIKMQRQKQSLLGDFFHGKNLYQRIKESKLEI